MLNFVWQNKGQSWKSTDMTNSNIRQSKDSFFISMKLMLKQSYCGIINGFKRHDLMIH